MGATKACEVKAAGMFVERARKVLRRVEGGQRGGHPAPVKNLASRPLGPHVLSPPQPFCRHWLGICVCQGTAWEQKEGGLLELTF